MINEERRKLQLEALQALRDSSFRGIVILPTGTGKSFVLIEALRELYKPGMSVLYTCDSIRLRDSDFDKELEKWDAQEYSSLMEKECYASAYKFEGRHYNILLADEGDYGLTPSYSKLFSENTFDYIIFVSATLEAKKRVIASTIAPIVYERKLKEIEENKVINKTQFYYVPYLLNEKENNTYLEYNKRFHHLLNGPETAYTANQLKFLTFERLHFLASLDSSAYICKELIKDIKAKKPESRILIFCGMTEQADRICPYTYHTKNQEDNYLDRFNNGEINEVAVCGKVDRGINLNGVNVTVMENVTTSETKMIQKFGRGKRLGVDDILDAYFLVPYYKQFKINRIQTYPTIILNKIQKACRNMGIENAKTYILKLGQ
jgi:superfamily II DNA or RNA helicase